MGTQAIVETKFNLSNEYAKSMFGDATSAIHLLTRDLPSVNPTPGTTTFTKPTLPTPVPVVPTTLKPDYGTVPDKPDPFPDLDVANDPVLDIPVSPTLLNFTLPDYVSEESIPVFSATVPLFNTEKLSVPEIICLRNDYSASLNDQIRSKLLANIRDGGTGLSATVEAAIFSRGTERDSQALQDAIDKTTAQWAKMGFSLPDGLLSSQLATLNKEYMNKRLDVSRDISIKQADLEQANLKYSLEYAMTIELKMLELGEMFATRAYEATKATAALLVQVYNANVDAYRASVQTYSAEAEAHRNFIQAKATEVEVYKARLEGQKILAEMNVENMKLYNAEWEGETVKIKLFDSQLQASATKLAYYKVVIDKYASEVQAYVAESNAKTAQYNADLVAFKSEADMWVAETDADMRKAEGDLKADIANNEKYLKDQEKWIEANKWNFEIAYAKLKDTADLSAKVASGALAGASAQASLSYGEKKDWGTATPTT